MYTRQASPLARESQRRCAAALLQLMRQYPYPDITVTQVCQQAGLARKTFYRNFDDKQDVVECLLDGMLEEFGASYGDVGGSIKDKISACFQFFDGQRDTLCLLHQSGLFHMIRATLEQYMAGACPDEKILAWVGQNDMESYFTSFISGGVHTVLELWVRRGFDKSREEITALACTLLPGCEAQADTQSKGPAEEAAGHLPHYLL